MQSGWRHPRDASRYANALPELEFQGNQLRSLENGLPRATRLSVTADYYCDGEVQSCGNPNSTVPNVFLSVLLHADHLWNLWAPELAMALTSTANNSECAGPPVCIDHAASSAEHVHYTATMILRSSSLPRRTCLISNPSNLVLRCSGRICSSVRGTEEWCPTCKTGITFHWPRQEVHPDETCSSLRNLLDHVWRLRTGSSPPTERGVYRH